MKNYHQIFIFLLLSHIVAFGQTQDNIPLMEKEDQGTNSPYRFLIHDANWHTNLGTSIQDSGYEYVGSSLDTAKVSTAIRAIIPTVYHNRLRKTNWVIITRLTGHGQIVSVSFLFKEEPPVPIEELSKLSAWMKREICYELAFDKPVTDSFYLLLSFSGNKF